MVLSEGFNLWIQTCEFDCTQNLSGSTIGLYNTINFKSTIKRKYMKVPINALYPVHNETAVLGA
jgi:hypothetical protein